MSPPPLFLSSLIWIFQRSNSSIYRLLSQYTAPLFEHHPRYTTTPARPILLPHPLYHHPCKTHPTSTPARPILLPPPLYRHSCYNAKPFYDPPHYEYTVYHFFRFQKSHISQTRKKSRIQPPQTYNNDSSKSKNQSPLECSAMYVRLNVALCTSA